MLCGEKATLGLTSTLEKLVSHYKKLGWLPGGVELGWNPGAAPLPTPCAPHSAQPQKPDTEPGPSLSSPPPRVPAQSQLRLLSKAENLQKDVNNLPAW